MDLTMDWVVDLTENKYISNDKIEYLRIGQLLGI